MTTSPIGRAHLDGSRQGDRGAGLGAESGAQWGGGGGSCSPHLGTPWGGAVTAPEGERWAPEGLRRLSEPRLVGGRQSGGGEG